MARRKSKFMDQDSDSESDSGDSAVDDQHDPNDDLIPRHAQGYQRGKKRTREQLKEDATYGVWAQQQASDEDDSTTARRRGLSSTASSRTRKQKDYLAGQSFVAAGSATSDALANKGEPTIDNLAASTNLAIQESKSDEEDVAMEMNSSDSDDSQHDAEDDDAEDEGVEEDDRADLAPIPGLGPTTTVEPTAVQDVEAPGDSLGFAPRGLGSARRGGGGGGIGARAGIGGRGGSAAGARGGIGSMSMFAAATAASDSNAGSVSQQKSAPSSGASTPRPGLGSMSSNVSARPSRGGIGSKGASTSLVDSLRAELNQPRPSSTTDSVPSSSAASPAPAAAPTRQPPAQVPHDLPPQRASASTSTSTEPAPRRSFLPAAPPVNKPKPKPLSRSESLHFNSLRSTNSVGLKLLEKMGWSAESGVGLGKDGTGIVVPLGEGQKVREKGAGIKSGERTKASWEEEARRKGVSVKELMGTKEDEDEAGEGRRDKGKQKRDKHREAWAGDEGAGAGSGKARNKKRERIKTEFKTYEEILAENGEDGTAERPRELLVDLSGNALPDQSLTSSLPAFGAGSADPTRLPELRHNLVLLTSTLSSHLRALAKEGSNVITRRKYLLAEEERVRVGVEKQEKKMTQLRQVLEVVQRVKDKENEVRELMSMVSISGQDADAESVELLLLKFEDEFDQLLGQYREEYEEMRLDQVVVGAITPICRRIFQSWDPLAQPSLCVAPFKRYRKLFLIDKHLAPSTATGSTSVDVYGSGRDRDLEGDMSERRRHKVESEREMTAFESFMWTIWLPKIRSAINNDWSPSDPTRAVTLFSTWSALLPSFLSSNILDQLVLPKLSTAISEWSPSAYKRGQAPGLHTIVFPWLEVAGQERMDGLLDECKRRVRSWVKSGWKAKEGVPQGLEVWKDAFAKSDWDTLLLQHVLPSLGSLLRDKLVINPRAQELSPIESVLAWRPLMTDRMTSQLLESEFFPKWGHALWVWLKSDHVNLEQVAEWYKWWKGYFPPDVVELKGVERGFRKGLDLMNQAMALGEDVKYRLKEPNFAPKQSASSSSSRNKPSGSTPSSTKSAAPGPVATEISFRSIVEDMCSGANLLFLSTGRTTARGRNLYRVSKNVDGKGGVLCYLEDDVVWLVVGKAGGEGDAEPVGIEDMIRRAKGTAK